jgi:hypothetical protein
LRRWFLDSAEELVSTDYVSWLWALLLTAFFLPLLDEPEIAEDARRCDADDGEHRADGIISGKRTGQERKRNPNDCTNNGDDYLVGTDPLKPVSHPLVGQR